MRCFGPFGDMAGHRLEPSHAAGPEPLSEAVDERRAALRSVRAIGSGSKLCLPWLHAFGDGDGKAQRLKTEAGIDRLDDTLELEIDETRDMGRTARRHRQADIDRQHLAIDAVESKPQGSRPDAVAHESRNEVLHEAGRDLRRSPPAC